MKAAIAILLQLAAGLALLPVFLFLLAAVALTELALGQGYRDTSNAVRIMEQAYCEITAGIIRNIKSI